MPYVPGVTSRLERHPATGTGAGVTLSASTHGVRMLHESEQENLPAPPYDPIAERLLRARTIIISGEITQRLAATVSSQLLALAADSDAEITIFINSQGGHVEAGDTIHDLLRFIRPRVRMIGTGWVASAGALIYVAAPLEQRFCLPNTRFLLHQPAGGSGGTASDIDIEAREILRMRDRLNRIFARETGQPLERIEEDTHRNFWLSAEAAQRYGLVGRIIERATELEA
jgi:ATP-dependent Clp protease protease subunit